MERPASYNKQPHPLIPFDKACTKCVAGKNRERYNKDYKKKDVAVGGAGPDDLTQVKLIVISDHPGHYESSKDTAYPMVDRREFQPEYKKGLLTPYNAGAMIRMSLELMYNLDTYEEVYFTNVFKCNPYKNKPLFNQQVKPCINYWLNPEMQVLSNSLPAVPILVAGNLAFKGLQFYFKNSYISSLTLSSCRRKKGLLLDQHPAVFTINPAGVARSWPKIETQARIGKGSKTYIQHNEKLPILEGSPIKRFIDDLKLLSPYLTKNE